MDYEGLILDKEADVATLTLNRPQQLNAVSLNMACAMEKVLSEIGQDNSTKVVIITGAGRGFCSGLDINALAEASNLSAKELNKLMQTLAFPVYNLAQPVIAAINGVAAGYGMALAMLCDMRIGSEKARFSSGYLRMGLPPDIGSTYSLPRIMGTAKAMELMVIGDTFDAAEAYRSGMLNKVVPEEDLMKEAREMATKIAKGPPLAIVQTKQAIRKGIHNSLEQQIAVECSAFYACLKTEDHQEGLNAFREKRPPEFKGK